MKSDDHDDLEQLRRETERALAEQRSYFESRLGSIQIYFEVGMKAQRDFFEARYASMQLAIDKAESAQNIRWEGANEFRGQLKDQTSTFATRAEGAQRDKEIDLLKQAQARSEGRATAYSFAIGIGFTLVNILLRFVRP